MKIAYLLLLIIIHNSNFVPCKICVFFFFLFFQIEDRTDSCLLFMRRCPQCTCYKFDIGTDSDNSLRRHTQKKQQQQQTFGQELAMNRKKKTKLSIWIMNFQSEYMAAFVHTHTHTSQLKIEMLKKMIMKTSTKHELYLFWV